MAATSRTPSLMRFLKEARRLARLSHPGIVTVHDFGVHEGQVYIVSDYLEGPDLSEWLKHNSPSWHEAARIAAAVADALAHAHARLTVHRDVKPANIILTPDRGPVLVDFGLGLDDSAAGAASSAPFPAPLRTWRRSRLRARRTALTAAPTSTVWAWCSTRCSAASCRFVRANTRELLRQVHDDEPQPPRQLVRDIPPELERVCLKALAKRLSDRYTTAADFARRPASRVPGGCRTGLANVSPCSRL